MSTEIIGLLGIVILIILICLRFWIGAAFAIVGFIGIVILNGFKTAMNVIVVSPFSNIDTYVMTAVPMFTLMGMIIANTNIGIDLFDFANKLLGRKPGGLASATVCASALICCVTGSDNVASVIMTKLAYPELKKRGYNDGLACASIAAPAPLALILPPSLGFILYGMLTEQSIAKLFIAGIIPGAILAVAFIVCIVIQCKIKPSLAPLGDEFTRMEKLRSLKGVVPVAILFVLVIGSIYMGVCTPTEAGGIGALGAFVIALVGRNMTFSKLVKILFETVITVGFVLFLLVGVFIFIRFMALSKFPFMISKFVVGLDVSTGTIILLVALIYFVLGMVIPQIPLVVLTVPILAPVMVALGIDMIWYGVFVIMMMALAAISPPIGLGVFIVSGISKVPATTIYRGLVPFYIAIVCVIFLVIFFPPLATWLPGRM